MMNDQDQINEEERQEAATETPAFLGCPQHMQKTLPGGFDGVGSATETVPPHGGGTRGEGVPPSQDVEKLNEILFERLGEIARKCCAVRSECDAKAFEDEAAETNVKLFGAFSELRQMCDFYKPREKPIDPANPCLKAERKHSMDFGRFHVTRAAIQGRTVLTFRRKHVVDEEHGSLVPGRIIIADVCRNDRSGKTMVEFKVKSIEECENPRILFSGVSQVSMSKTEKIVYKMVKCNIKETQRRYITRKRKMAAKRGSETLPPQGHGGEAVRGGGVSPAQKEVK